MDLTGKTAVGRAVLRLFKVKLPVPDRLPSQWTTEEFNQKVARREVAIVSFGCPVTFMKAPGDRRYFIRPASDDDKLPDIIIGDGAACITTDSNGTKTSEAVVLIEEEIESERLWRVRTIVDGISRPYPEQARRIPDNAV